MTGAEFNRLIEKYHQGTASAAERAIVDAWFESLQNSEWPFTWNEKDEHAQFDNIRKAISLPAVPMKVVPLYSRRWLQAAASLTILIAAACLIWYTSFRNEINTISSDADQTRKTILSDGTLVWLKPNSTLNFPETFDDAERTVLLKGEALFEVAKDPRHPFVIKCGAFSARVLGTSFNIRTNDKTLELTVLTGKVELSSGDRANTLVVLPNQKVSYDGSALTDNIPLEVPEKQLVIVGTEYDMAFRNAPVKTILGKIEGKFGKQVNLVNSKLNDCLFTADFTDQSLDDTLRLLAGILGFEYTINASTVTIKGGTCSSE